MVITFLLNKDKPEPMFTKLKEIEMPVELVECWFPEVGYVIYLVLSDYIIGITY